MEWRYDWALKWLNKICKKNNPEKPKKKNNIWNSEGCSDGATDSTVAVVKLMVIFSSQLKDVVGQKSFLKVVFVLRYQFIQYSCTSISFFPN